MSQNFLQLNHSKTEVLVFAPIRSLLTSSNTLVHWLRIENLFPKIWVSFLTTSWNLINMLNQLFSPATSTWGILQKYGPLSFQQLETVIHAFVSSRLDYCNALYSCLSQDAVTRLQLVQNSAARLLTKTSYHSHITPVLMSLHWLPIKFRIQFKILLLTYKASNGLAPEYIAELLMPYTPARPLRSSEQSLLVAPWSSLKNRGDCAFAVLGPRMWNSLPLGVRSANSLGCFKSQLKTYLFSQCFYAWVIMYTILICDFNCCCVVVLLLNVMVCSFNLLFLCKALCNLCFERCYINKILLTIYLLTCYHNN